MRFNMPGPFWYEDLFYSVIDEARRLPDRLTRGARLASQAWTHRRQLAADLKRAVTIGRKPAPSAVRARHQIRPEPDLLDEPIAWSLATEPLVRRDASAEAAIAFHHAAHQQLDATIYVLDRLCDELRPLMQSYPLPRHTVDKLPEPIMTIEEQLRALRAFADAGKQEKKPAKAKKRKPRSAA